MKISPRVISVRLVLLAVALLCAGIARGIDVIAPPNAVWRQIAGAQINPPQLQSLQATQAMQALRLNLSGFHEAGITRNNIKFSRLTFPDGATTSEIGRPEIPVVRWLVAVPDGATVQVAAKGGTAKTYPKMQVYPVQPPVAEQRGMLELPFRMDTDFYKRDALYPPQQARVSPPMKIRNTTVVLVEMAPMQFNPARQQLTVFQDMDVQLTFSKPAPRLGRVSLATQIVRPAAGILNADIYRIDRDILAKLAWDYLIITPDAYVANLQPLVDWKRARGLSVQVQKLSQVGSTVDQIKSCIQSAYDQHSVKYVLLVGDTNAIPPYMYQGASASDYHYALVSGNDLLPDVAVGRFSVRSAVELDNLVKKSVDYEKTPYKGNTAWYKKATLVSDQGYFQDTSNWVATFLTGRGYTVQKLYRSAGTATISNVSAAINDGRAIVNYRGHGGETGWDTSGFSNANVNTLTNGRMLPAIISPTCLTGCYDYNPSDCYSETWVKSYGAAPRGAVAYWGSSRISYGGYNDELCKGAYKALFDDNLPCMGDIVNKAKMYMVAAYGIDNDTAKLELYLFNLFGDPELRVWTAVPPG